MSFQGSTIGPNESPEEVDPNVRKKELLDNAADRIVQRMEKLDLVTQMAESGDPDLAPQVVHNDVDKQQQRIDGVSGKLHSLDKVRVEVTQYYEDGTPRETRLYEGAPEEIRKILYS